MRDLPSLLKGARVSCMFSCQTKSYHTSQWFALLDPCRYQVRYTA